MKQQGETSLTGSFSSTDEHDDRSDDNNDNPDIENDDNDENNIKVPLSKEEKELIVALANRSYHLPGHSYCSDLCQYFINNHPLFGIFCHYRIHPIKTKMRIIALLGSILFGLLVSNLFVLLILDDETYQRPIFFISTNNTAASSLYSYSGTTSDYTYNGNSGDDGETSNTFALSDQDTRTEWGEDDVTTISSTTVEVYITSGMLLLWTVGGGVHAMFDLSLWYIVACACCPHSKKYRKLGRIVVLASVILTAAVATFFMVLRASLEEQEQREENDYEVTSLHTFGDSAGLVDDTIQLSHEQVISVGQVNFVHAYMIEFGMALLVYYPLGSLILFTGILGYGRLPILGGRPRDIWLESKQRKQKMLRLDAASEGVDGVPKIIDPIDLLEDHNQVGPSTNSIDRCKKSGTRKF